MDISASFTALAHQSRVDGWVAEHRARGHIQEDALVYALIKSQHVDQVRYALSLGANPNRRTPDNRGVFESVILNVDAASLDALLQGGMDPDTVDWEGRPAVFCCVGNNLIEKARLLIRHGANVHVINRGKSFLFYALEASAFGLARELLEGEVDWHQRGGKHERTLLHAALNTGKFRPTPDAVHVLCKLLPHFDLDTMDARGISHAQMMRDLYRSPRLKNSYWHRETARILHAALEGRVEEMVVRAMEMPPHPPLSTVLHEVAKERASGPSLWECASLPEIRQALRCGAPIDETDARGCTALFLQAARGQRRACAYLIKHGANVNIARADTGETPLHCAAKRDSVALLMTLIDGGANVVARDLQGITCLHIAIQHARLDNIKVLVENGADLHAVDHHGNTGLHYAFRADASRAMPTAAWLLDQGVDPLCRNAEGRTAWEELNHAYATAGMEMPAWVSNFMEQAGVKHQYDTLSSSAVFSSLPVLQGRRL